MKLFAKYRIPKTPEQRRLNRKNILLGLFSGIMIGLSYPPIPLPYLVFVAFVPYFIVIEKRDKLAEINRFTYFTAFIFNLITLYWVGGWLPNSDPFLMIAGTTLLFFNPIVFLIPSTLYYLTKKYINRKLALLLFPLFWITFEFAYSLTDFKFPWLTLGNTLSYFTNYIQIADIIGVYGLTVLILFANIFVYYFKKDISTYGTINKKALTGFVLLILLPIIYGNYRIFSFASKEGNVKVGLIQPNIDPNEKWKDGNLNEKIDSYLSLSKNAIDSGAQIIIWPETALPVYLLAGNYPNEVKRIHEFADSNKTSILTGMPDATVYYNLKNAPDDAKPSKDGKTSYTSYNSILLFNPNSTEVQKYGKMKLVPFGEKVPLVESLPFLGDWIKWNVGISSWNTGRDTTIFQAKSFDEQKEKIVKIGGIICIESIYPIFTSIFVNKGAEFIVVVTNDSWYGDTSGPYQHKEMSVIRAVENKRSVVRAANGGISCLIDPLGKTITETKMYTKTTLVVDVSLNSELTFYTKHPWLIPIFASVISIIIILLSSIAKIKRKYNDRFTK
ncbi:MAG: apolipoprotein N-acyltransferase [Bacteroidetes bacterium]|nr:apolipoprotein N-acyltransferase [Bacteroidota bacterium]MBU1113686.1 apolipoprotein N-acyltransferase [Bacteroidota bacterium]MBU1799095.1 apolipoprotein N-acyltransferase [Bacteroidota bacterium]